MTVTALDLDVLRGKRDLTVDDLDGLPEDLRYELIDGRLVLSPFALPIHQFVSKRVGDAIEKSAPADSDHLQAVPPRPQWFL